MLKLIETQRLYLVPMRKEELHWWMHDIAKLENEWQACYCDDVPAGDFMRIVAAQYEKVCQNPEQWLYHTFMLIIVKDGKKIIGSCDFKAPPNEQGEVEIGYGIHADFQNRGYMTESVIGMVKWAFTQNNIVSVTAETESGNIASEIVLTKAGFERRRSYPDQNGSTWWFLEK